MGYTTYFEGQVDIDPPLNQAEIDHLNNFADIRWGASQPSYYCQWVPTEDGTALVWDEGEKFYGAAEWMQHLIDNFLRDNHVLNGEIEAAGEESDDRWKLVVVDNKVSVKQGRIVYEY